MTARIAPGPSRRAISAATAIAVLRDRLKDNGFWRDAGAVDFLAHEEAMIVIVEQDRRRETGFFRQAGQCRTEK